MIIKVVIREKSGKDTRDVEVTKVSSFNEGVELCLKILTKRKDVVGCMVIREEGD